MAVKQSRFRRSLPSLSQQEGRVQSAPSRLPAANMCFPFGISGGGTEIGLIQPLPFLKSRAVLQLLINCTEIACTCYVLPKYGLRLYSYRRYELTDESITDKKLSRRQFVGTAAAGATALGAVAGATTLVPHVAAASSATGLKALNTAGGLKATPVPTNWAQTADVVVVGYGSAGAVAAMTAFDAGADVLILEKTPSLPVWESPTITRTKPASRVVVATHTYAAEVLVHHRPGNTYTVDVPQLLRYDPNGYLPSMGIRDSPKTGTKPTTSRTQLALPPH